MKSGRVQAIVEIGGDCIKVARVEKRATGPFIAGVRVGRVRAEGDQAGFIRSALHELKMRGVPVLVLLPRQVVNLRLLDLPSVNKAELADMLELQIGKQTPYTRDEIVSGYEVLSGAREGYSRVMLAIVQKAALRQRIQPIEQAGAEIGSVTISTDGLVGWFAASSDGGSDLQTVAVLDVDVSTSEFLVLSDGKPLFTRSIPVGADGDSAATQIAREFERSVEACQGEMPGRSLSRIVLTGGAGGIQGLGETIARRLSVPCETREALRGFKADPKIAPDAGVSLAAVAGIAAQGGRTAFDLLADTILAKRILLNRARNLTTLAVLAASAMISLTTYGLVLYMFPLSSLKAARAEAASMEQSVRDLERMREIISLARARQGNSMSPARVLDAVVRALPAGTRICGVDIDYRTGLMTLQADCDNTKNIRSFEDSLRGAGGILSAKERNTRVDPTTQRWAFEISAKLEAAR